MRGPLAPPTVYWSNNYEIMKTAVVRWDVRASAQVDDSSQAERLRTRRSLSRFRAAQPFCFHDSRVDCPRLPAGASKDSLTESFVQALYGIPADVLQQVRVRVHRLRDRRMAQERLDDLRMLASFEESCGEGMA